MVMARLVDGLHTSRTTKLGDEYKPRALLHTAVPRFTVLFVGGLKHFLPPTPLHRPPPVSPFADDAVTSPAPSNDSVYTYDDHMVTQLQALQQG